MAFKDFFFKKQEPKEINETNETPYQGGYQMYSTPFGKIGDGNLSLPYVNTYGINSLYVRFGSDNLFPQVLNQLYYISPMHSNIVNFKQTSIIGNGYEIEPLDKKMTTKVDIYSFETKADFNCLMDDLTYDLIMHQRIHVLMHSKDGVSRIVKRISPEKVRMNPAKSCFYISDDWSRGINTEEYKEYTPTSEGYSMYYYEIKSPGQDVYPIPRYASANNWMFLSGEMSYLQKQNIINSIFPAMALFYNKKFESKEAFDAFQDQLRSKKGARTAGDTMIFLSDKVEEQPTLQTVDTNKNDGLFNGTTDNMLSEICRAHGVPGVLVGIEKTGKLGNTQEIKDHYLVFEKTIVMPLRLKMEVVGNQLLDICSVKGKFKINNFTIIDEEIIEIKK